MKCDLRFDPKTMDILCLRDADGCVHVNISQALVHHSPDGFEFGYGGSGPADFALNILDLFAKAFFHQKAEVKLFRGCCTPLAWRFHQDFKRTFIATLPRAGGLILGAEIRAWLERKIAEGN